MSSELEYHSASADGAEEAPRQRRRKKVRQRFRLSGSNPELRRARKLREKWTHRRQAVQLRVLVVAAVVFLTMFIVSVIDILTDNFSVPYIYEVLITLASLALMVWGVFRLVERFVTVRYRRISNRKRSEELASLDEKSAKRPA